ncbi:MAG: hypothetical protein ACFBSF_22605 [Leptolyngbyaceae cyanobacterium]
MAILSPLKSRRLRSHKGEATQQVIVFQIQQDWFALPIFAVKKVVPRNETQGDYHGTGAGLTVYEGKELLVLDIQQQIFGNQRDRSLAPNSTAAAETPTTSPALSTAQQATSADAEAKSAAKYLLIIRDRQGDIIGLPTQSAPTVRRVAQSAMVALPSSYAAKINVQCVTGLIVQSDDQPLLFFLNPDQLFHSQPLLPPGS